MFYTRQEGEVLQILTHPTNIESLTYTVSAPFDKSLDSLSEATDSQFEHVVLWNLESEIFTREDSSYCIKLEISEALSSLSSLKSITLRENLTSEGTLQLLFHITPECTVNLEVGGKKVNSCYVLNKYSRAFVIDQTSGVFKEI